MIASHHDRESRFCTEDLNHFTPDLVVISDVDFEVQVIHHNGSLEEGNVYHLLKITPEEILKATNRQISRVRK